jgi:hypothetical protein
MKVYLINRQDSVQTEMDPETMKYTKGEVKWVGDCKYELYYRMSNSAVPGSARTDTMSTEILSWTRDYYLFRSFVGGKLLLSDTMWIKKDEAENSK